MRKGEAEVKTTAGRKWVLQQAMKGTPQSLGLALNISFLEVQNAQEPLLSWV